MPQNQTIVKVKRNTTENWQQLNPILEVNEFAVEMRLPALKAGYLESVAQFERGLVRIGMGCTAGFTTHQSYALHLLNALKLPCGSRFLGIKPHCRIKSSLRTCGIEHYYKAKVHPRILYVEGTTDIKILKALAAHTDHKKAEALLMDRLNVYYTQNVDPEDTLNNELYRKGGAFGDHLPHFHTLKGFIGTHLV